MSGYLVNFIVYTTAMVGIIFLAVFVYKKFSYCGVSKSKFLDLEASTENMVIKERLMSMYNDSTSYFGIG